MPDYQLIINRVYSEIKKLENIGKIADYIPELKNVDPEKFGVHLISVDGKHISAGNNNEKFSIQSIAKVISLTLAYKKLGGELWTRVGVEPSGNPFNSLVQLEYDMGIPRNPFINAGALLVCDVLMDIYQDYEQCLLNFIRTLSGNHKIDFNIKIAESEKELGYRNAALINLMKSFGNIKNDVSRVLDFYFKLCSIEMTCKELSQTFMIFATGGIEPIRNSRILELSPTKRINAIMQTCGFYDEAGDFAYRVGLPGKSGVGGGIIAIHPAHYSIAVWSPPLNRKGNSYKGIQFLEQFTSETQLSIF